MYDARQPRMTMIGAGTAKDTSSTGVFAYTYNLVEAGRVWRLLVKTTTAIVSTGGVVITFRRRPTYGSSSGQTVLGTVTVPGSAAANAVYYNDITPVNLSAGDQIVADCTTAATTSGSAFAEVFVDLNPETATNEGYTKVTA